MERRVREVTLVDWLVGVESKFSRGKKEERLMKVMTVCTGTSSCL